MDTNVDVLVYGRSAPCLSLVYPDEWVAVVVSVLLKDADRSMFVLSVYAPLGVGVGPVFRMVEVAACASGYHGAFSVGVDAMAAGCLSATGCFAVTSS